MQLKAGSFRFKHLRVLHTLAMAACVFYIVLCLGVLFLKWVVFPSLDQHLPALEARLSAMAGAPVSMQKISAHWQGFHPRFEVEHLQLLNPDGSVGASAKSLQFSLAWSSFWVMGPRFNNIVLDHPVLRIQRDKAGHIRMGGVALPLSQDPSHPGLNWLLHQRQVSVVQAKLGWQDDTAQTPAIQMDQLNILLKNGFGHHRFSAYATAAALSDSPIIFKTDFRIPLWVAQNGDWSHWKGSAFAQLKQGDLKTLNPWLSQLPIQFAVSKPTVAAWADFQNGAVNKVLLQTQAKQVALSSKQANANPFLVSQFNALVEVSGGASLLRPSAVSVKQLSAVLTDGERFGPADLAIKRTETPTEQRWKLSVQNLDAQQAKGLAMALAPLVGREDEAKALAAYELSGLLKHVALSWETPPNTVIPVIEELVFDSDIDFDALTVLYKTSSRGQESKVTGFKNLSGIFDGNNAKGHWKVSGKHTDLALPEVFAYEVLQFDTVEGEGSWTNLLSAEKPLHLTIDKLHAANEDVSAKVKGTYLFNRDQPDVIDLTGDIERADVGRVAKYMPLVVGEHTLAWLNDNLKDGKASKGTLVLRGPLNQFPFHDKPDVGLFEISVPFTQGELTYSPGWPSISHIDGRAVFKGKAMMIESDSAVTSDIKLTKVRVGIENLGAQEPILKITGNGQGLLSNMVDFVNNSPVNEFVSHALTRAQTEGNANLKIGLKIPLKETRQTQVEGTLSLAQNSLQLVRGMPKVTDLVGDIKFSNKGLFIDALKGKSLGDNVSVTATTSPQGQLQIKAHGVATAQGLAQYIDPQLSPYLKGTSVYDVNVTSHQNRLDVAVNSTLQGIGVSLPAPFNKTQEALLPLKVHQVLSAQGEDWDVEVGTPEAPLAKLNAHFLADADPKSISSKLASLDFAVGSPLKVAGLGIQGVVRIKALDVDVWRKLIAALFDGPQQSLAEPSLLSALKPNSEKAPLKTRVLVLADHFSLGSKNFDNVALTAKTVENRWQFDVKAEGVDGYLSWVQDAQRPDGAVLARFKTLRVPKSIDKEIKEAVDEPVSSIPALDIQVEDFTLNALKLGKLSLLAFNQTREEQAQATLSEKPKEWRLQKMVLENPESTTEFSGSWRYGQKLSQQRTDITINQTVRDGGGLLARLGMADVFKGGEGSLVGKLKWNDAPSSLDYASLTGQFKLISKNGQFLKADPGAAKLLGVLSLQSIPRRLTLDFKDLFSKGFSYDMMEANVSLKDGVASTEDFKMQGPSATVLMDGNLNLEAETQNLSVLVLPELNTAGGSLLYSVIAANPAIGLATLLADLVLKDPLSKIFSFQYNITGPWAEPLIERVKVKPKEGVKP